MLSRTGKTIVISVVFLSTGILLTGCPPSPVQYTLSTAVQGNGSIDPPAGAHVYEEGQTVTVTATPTTGWHFDHWTGDLDGDTNPATLTMDGNRTVTAIFISDYDRGFSDGFARDDWYWQGYDDSDATMDYSPLYYQGSDIPNPVSPEYDKGYWDGVWYAYNDGYFVCYDYAFTVGFSEGYDAAYFSGYLNFLATDQHVEYDNGGWADGYNDGFSEGRVFGANDYEQGLAFDWLDAMTDYRSGTDLNFAEIGVGTGAYGPVILYEYGTDPAAKALRGLAVRRTGVVPSIRADSGMKAANPPALSYRPLTSAVQEELNKRPTTTDRDPRPLTLTTTWLERVNAYLDSLQQGGKSAYIGGNQD
jgi:hypothetical protein